MFLARKVSLVRAIFYIAAQCLGAICGCALVKAFQGSHYNAYGGGANVVAHGYSTGTGLAAEIIGTLILVYTVFSATDPTVKKPHVPVSTKYNYPNLSHQHIYTHICIYICKLTLYAFYSLLIN